MRTVLFILTAMASGLMAKDSFDIYVSDKVVVQRAVINGPSARMIAVGHPGGFNFAFEAVHCAPTYAWFGGFIDFKGEITGRGGRRCQILGIERPLGIPAAPLRFGNAESLPKSLTFQGYRRDKLSANPTFLFEVDGVTVEQRLSSPAANTIAVTLNFPGGLQSPAVYLLDGKQHANVTLGEGLVSSTPRVIEIPAGTVQATFTITLKESDKVFTRIAPKLTSAEIFQLYCNACHSTDGSKLIGPSFQGISGRPQTVTRDGKEETITIDNDYLLESILDPQAAIVKGYEHAPMANFSSILTKKQIRDVVDYLHTFK